MPWSENNQMSRCRFVAEFDSCLYTMTELCERHGISRKTGYKWLSRYRETGVVGLEELSSAPRTPSQTIDHAIMAGRGYRPAT